MALGVCAVQESKQPREDKNSWGEVKNAQALRASRKQRKREHLGIVSVYEVWKTREREFPNEG